MRIDSLKLINYRNYEALSISFNKNINLILGKNGQGKTNIVEAISLLSIGRSFRTRNDKNLIRFGSDSLYVGCGIFNRNIHKKIEVSISNDKKGIKINSMSIKSIQELLGNLNVVVFSPEDLKLVKEGPKERRAFLDKEISQILPRYYKLLVSYTKVLNQRNKLLKSNMVDDSLLDVYDIELANYGSEIYKIRMEFIDKLSMISNDLHSKLTSNVEDLKIVYKNQLELDCNNKLHYDVNYIKSLMLDKVSESRMADKLKRSTRVGPHRDDFDIIINDFNVRTFGSQGQQRTASISLKLSEIELIKREVGEYPVLILDDVFSELDEMRQRMLIEKLGDVQMFVTSADALHKNILRTNSYRIFNIDKGSIVSIEDADSIEVDFDSVDTNDSDD